MNPANQSGNKPSVNRSHIARAIFAATESMGIRDRRTVERLTTQVIERLEKTLKEYTPVLPGMEDLVGKRARRQRLPTDAEIEAMVKEILTAEKPAKQEEVKPEMEATTVTKTKVQPSPSINLTKNALQVLERRYLKKDKEGQVIETPEEMFRRVAHAIAAAERIYNPKTDVKAWEERFYQLMASLLFLPNSPP
jgi:ribonucleoside-diphosphate reductase alpha chain